MRFFVTVEQVLLASLLLFPVFSSANESFGESGTDGPDEWQSTTDSKMPFETVSLDETEQKRLVVEWDKPSIGYFEIVDSDDDPVPTYRKWKNDNALHPDRMLEVRGRLLLESVDGKIRKPVDWFQGVRVIVSRDPDTKHDWSNRQEMVDAVWDECILSKNGEFVVTVSPGEVRRTTGKVLPFQVALSLGRKTGRQITWKNTFGVLPQSVATLKISGPPAISASMQIINGAPSYDYANFNPAKLVRAVNHLVPMGKEKAIHELREFLKVARDSWEVERVDDNIDTSNKNCVFLIVRLLFEPEVVSEDRPMIGLVPFAPIPKDVDQPLWPLHPIHVQDGLPFFLVDSGGMGGASDEPERHVDWAEASGRLRKDLLRPADNPMLAASTLISLPQTKRLYDEPWRTSFDDLIYQQAWNTIQDVNRVTNKLTRPPDNEEVDWKIRLNTALDLKLRWSPIEQKYVTP